jgi:DNA-binding CsgD family transcriptional regulator
VIEGLTSRQHQVARLAADGLTVEEIANELHIKPPTVRSHLDCVRMKLGVRRKREIGRALREQETK